MNNPKLDLSFKCRDVGDEFHVDFDSYFDPGDNPNIETCDYYSTYVSHILVILFDDYCSYFELEKTKRNFKRFLKGISKYSINEIFETMSSEEKELFTEE